MMERPKDEELSWTEETYNYVDKLEFENNNLKKENEELNKLKESFPDGIGDYEWKVIENYNSKNFVITELKKENEELKAENEFYLNQCIKLGCDKELLISTFEAQKDA